MKSRQVALVLVLLFAGIAGTAALASVADLGSGENLDPAALTAKRGPVEHHRSTEINNSQMVLRGYMNAAGQRCLEQDVAGEGVGAACIHPTDMFKGREVFVTYGGRQATAKTKKFTWDSVWVQGIVSPRVKSLELLDTDCTVRDLAFDERGVFLHAAGRADIARGVVPFKLVAHDGDGHVIHEQTVLVGLPKNGKEAGLSEPKASSECA